MAVQIYKQAMRKDTRKLW